MWNVNFSYRLCWRWSSSTCPYQRVWSCTLCWVPHWLDCWTQPYTDWSLTPTGRATTKWLWPPVRSSVCVYLGDDQSSKGKTLFYFTHPTALVNLLFRIYVETIIFIFTLQPIKDQLTGEMEHTPDPNNHSSHLTHRTPSAQFTLPAHRSVIIKTCSSNQPLRSIPSVWNHLLEVVVLSQAVATWLHRLC